MLFEIVRMIDGETVMFTTSEKCIPPEEVIKDAVEHGHFALLDGKKYKF